MPDDQLPTHRCPVCAWVGSAEGELPPCPTCGHGLVAYRIERA